jgi:hypothetical protein
VRLRKGNKGARRAERRRAHERSDATWQRMVATAAASGSFKRLRNSGYLRRMKRDIARLRRIDPEGLKMVVRQEFERRRLACEYD